MHREHREHVLPRSVRSIASIARRRMIFAVRGASIVRRLLLKINYRSSLRIATSGLRICGRKRIPSVAAVAAPAGVNKRDSESTLQRVLFVIIGVFWMG